MAKKQLTDCRSEAERRANYPQLCSIADMIEKTPAPLKVAAAVTWIIRQRIKEKEAAAQDGK